MQGWTDERSPAANKRRHTPCGSGRSAARSAADAANRAELGPGSRSRCGTAACTGSTAASTRTGTPNLSREGRWLAAVLRGRRRSRARLSHCCLSVSPDPLRAQDDPRDRARSNGGHSRGSSCGRAGTCDPRDITVVNGIPVTTVPRTLVDLTDVMEPDDLANVIHEAAFRKLFSEAATRQAMERAPGRKLSVLEEALRLHNGRQRRLEEPQREAVPETDPRRRTARAAPERRGPRLRSGLRLARPVRRGRRRQATSARGPRPTTGSGTRRCKPAASPSYESPRTNSQDRNEAASEARGATTSPKRRAVTTPRSQCVFGTLNGASRSRANDRSSAGSAEPTNERRHRLPPLRIGPPEHPRLGHRRVRQQNRLDLRRHHVLARRTRSCPPCAPRTISRPRSSNRPRSPVCSTPPPATEGPETEDLAVVRQRHARARAERGPRSPCRRARRSSRPNTPA